jgi:hypothetical protein
VFRTVADQREPAGDRRRGESPDLAQIVDIVRYDRALTAALWRSANSSWSAARTEIATVRDAVVRLGAGPRLDAISGARARGLTRMHAEHEVLGIEHAELAETIARAWRLPVSLVAGIAAHHSPGSAPDSTTSAAGSRTASPRFPPVSPDFGGALASPCHGKWYSVLSLAYDASMTTLCVWEARNTRAQQESPRGTWSRS